MIEIKFSHHYTKFPPTLEGTELIGVQPVNLETLDPDFLERDTAIKNGGHYPLPKKGKYMILWLRTTSGAEWWEWQTIRRWTPEKEAYYRAHVGELVECVVTG